MLGCSCWQQSRYKRNMGDLCKSFHKALIFFLVLFLATRLPARLVVFSLQHRWGVPTPPPTPPRSHINTLRRDNAGPSGAQRGSDEALGICFEENKNILYCFSMGRRSVQACNIIAPFQELRGKNGKKRQPGPKDQAPHQPFTRSAPPQEEDLKQINASERVTQRFHGCFAPKSFLAGAA